MIKTTYGPTMFISPRHRFLKLAQLAAWAAVIIFPSPAIASSDTIKVAFLEVRDTRGNLTRLEPNFPWAHMAISVDNGWLHAHPATGVEWTSTAKLEQFGRIAHIMPVPNWFKPHMELVDGFIGHPYDRDFSWDDNSFYCSELVAKILGFAPVPMVFDPQFWPASYLRFNGKPGISPGLVYRRLVQE